MDSRLRSRHSSVALETDRALAQRWLGEWAELALLSGAYSLPSPWCLHPTGITTLEIGGQSYLGSVGTPNFLLSIVFSP